MLWDTAHDMYGDFEGTTFNETKMIVKFKSGATIQHKSCGSDRDLKNFDGGQYSLVVWDEAQWHSKNQISYLFSRVRSKAKGPHQVLATCNPHPDAAIRPFVEWYLDQSTGIPIPERSGTVRYFAEYKGDWVFGDTAEELREKYSQALNPQTYRFIAATIRDNPVLMERDPDYLNRLENLKPSERARLLMGSWYVREEASKFFKREWVTFVDHPPVDACQRIRAWDFGYTLQSEANRDPDYTASVLVSRSKEGIYTIEDATRFRKLAGEHVKEVVEQAKFDGIDDVQVVVPRENGPGKAWSQYLTRELAEQGVPVKTVMVSGWHGKLSRFKPVASLAENGHIQIVRGNWNEAFLNEIEAFDGARNSGGMHDDWVDALSDAVIQLSRGAKMPVFTLPSCSEFTKSNPMPFS